MRTIRMHKQARMILGILVVTGLFSGCTFINENLGPLGSISNTDPVITATSTTVNTAMPSTITVAVTSESRPAGNDTTEVDGIEPTASPESGMINLSVWIPPQFDPAQGTDEAKIFSELINEFLSENPQVSLSLRIKATAGTSSAINTLSAAKNAAPDVIPSLVFLDRADLLSASQKGLIYPIRTTIFSDSSTWYNFSKQASVIDNLIYGIPIAGDTLVLVFRPSKTGAEMTTWDEILSRGLPIAFSPSSSDALFPTFIYAAMGGKLVDDQGQAWLDQSILTQALHFFLAGGQNGAFPPSLSQIVDNSQNWQMFLEGSVSILVSKFSTYRHNQGTDVDAIALPFFPDHNAYPLMTTWNIALTTDDPAKQEYAIKLAEKLADPIFNDRWTAAAGYFPVRKSEHAAWQNDAEYETILAINPVATLVPNPQILNKITPILNSAVSKVINTAASPEQAAQEAIEELD